MRKILSLSNVTPADATYPFGRVKDTGSGAFNGTPVNEAMLGDLLQTAMKLMSEGSIVPNDLPDNQNNGFQIYQAMLAVMATVIDSKNTIQNTVAWTNATSLLVNGWINSPVNGIFGQLFNIQYYKDPWGWVHLRGGIQTSTTSNGNNLTILTLPAGFRPLANQNFTVSAYEAIFYAGSAPVRLSINSDGTIVPHDIKNLYVLNNLGSSDAFLSLDGISFKTDI